MIPVIDLSKYPENSKQLIEACEEWGCFRLINHGVPLKMMSEMKSVARSLIDRPIKRRMKSGYTTSGEAHPIYETLGLFELIEKQVVDEFCEQLDCSSHQREIIQVYAKKIDDLVMDVALKIAESMGVVGDLFKGWHCLFRINKYNFKPESVGSLGVQLHTDSGFLALLQDDENVGGLEVVDQSGKFVAVDPLPDSFFVNLGDMATVWSNGRLCAVKHRVQCNEALARTSIVTFLSGPKNGNVEAPEEIIDGEHPRLYKPFNHDNYKNVRMTNRLLVGEALARFRNSSSK